MSRRPSTLLPALIPEPGQRIGRVSPHGAAAAEDQGIVLCLIMTKLGTHALVLMDSGKTATCHGLNRAPGIGWHAL